MPATRSDSVWIRSREVIVFLARPETVANAPAARAMLAADDLAHIDRMRFHRDREIALASRVVQRKALSSCANIAPDAWRFVADDNGRPMTVAPGDAPPLSFSVANAHGLVGCAVTLSREVGFDIERLRSDAPEALIARCLTPYERAALAVLPVDRQPRRLLELWTLKEAYVKARGLGLLLGLDRVEVSIEDGRPSLALDPSVDDDAGFWQLAQWSPTESHVVALCVRRDDNAPLTIDTRWVS